MTPRLRNQSGMTLIEVLVTILVVSVGTLATLGTYVHFSSATRTARDRAVLNSVAQREVERLRPLAYEQLALVSAPTAAAGAEAPLAGPAGGEETVTGGIVRPGGDDYTYDGVRMRIYRYVTYRKPTCSGLTPKIQSQLAGRLGLTLAQVQAALANACELGISTTKRITVVAVPVDGDGDASGRGVVMSTVKRDPESLPILDVPTSALSVEPLTDVLQGGAAVDPEQAVTQTVTLTDTRCSDTVRDAPSDHETRDTAQFGWTCAESGPAPKLMTLAGIPGAASDPVADFSTDVVRAALGGLAVLRDTQAGSCTATDNLVYANAETEDRMHAVHKWATLDPSGPVAIPASGGRASLTLFASTADATPGPARLCATLQTEAGVPLGSSDFELATWPGRVTELTTAFDIAGGTIPAGQRLILTLRVPADSGEDLRILYDHPSYQSALSFTTEAGSGFAE